MDTERAAQAVRRDVLLPAPREEVWAALTRSELLSGWFEAEVEIDPRPRGAVTARDRGGTLRRGTVAAANRPYRLVVVWNSTIVGREPGAGPTRMEFTLEAVAEGTRLTVIEAPVAASSPEATFLEAAR